MSQLLFEENDLVYHYEYGEGLVVTECTIVYYLTEKL